MKNFKVIVYLFIIVLLEISFLDARNISKNNFTPDRDTNISLAPGASTIDRVEHNQGNISTTIDNYGYVGGYSSFGLPSGEWPRNSDHSYLAEIRYWMGATMPNGDTAVANTYDDFQAMEMPVSNTDEYTIYLSTDTTRYYNYDITDTIGLAENRPANGWRVWDESVSDWDYNQKFNTLVTSFTEGGPTSEQDSYYRFNDAASGTSLMGLELTHSVYQWNFCYNEDFMFVVLDITNTSANDYTDFAFGLYVDLDVGGADGLGENGRLNDAVVYDTANGWAYNYDVIGVDPGWNAKTGIMGTKLLETPNNVGMTAFRTDDWALLPEDDPGKFAMINSTQYDTPLAPTDQFYIQAVRGINLAAGTTVRVVYALIGADDSTDFVQNTEAVQTLYDAFYVGPEPPKTPTLTVRPGDEKVYLEWNNTAESSTDPLSNVADFSGYKLYRSTDLGKTWGAIDNRNENSCLELDYETIASYSVPNPGDPIPHTFIDTGLFNEVQYWYCLVAHDSGDSLTGGDPLQNGFGAEESINVVKVTPRTNPAGYFEAASTVEHTYTGSGVESEGEIFPTVFDLSAMIDGDYKVVFEDTPDETYWHLINTTTSDTVLANQTLTNGEDPGLYDVASGLRVVVNDGDVVPRSYGQTVGDTNLVLDQFYGVGLESFYNGDVVFGHEHFRSTYEIRYTGDSSLVGSLGEWLYNSSDLEFWVPFEVWNISTNQRVSFVVYDFDQNDIWDSYDLLNIINYPYNDTANVMAESFPDYYSWMIGFDETVYNPQIGDVFTIEGASLNGPQDEFLFKVDGINSQSASDELKNIKVVPNPYFVSYEPTVEQVYDLNTALHFTNLPDECTIRIYNLAGDLVRTIDHNEIGGDATWNLLSLNGQKIASGIYLYHVESQYGEFLGRFAVVK